MDPPGEVATPLPGSCSLARKIQLSNDFRDVSGGPESRLSGSKFRAFCKFRESEKWSPRRAHSVKLAKLAAMIKESKVRLRIWPLHSIRGSGWSPPPIGVLPRDSH